MHWIKLTDTWWIDIDKAYFITVWRNSKEIRVKFANEIIEIEECKWDKTEYERILREVMELVEEKSSGRNGRMLRIREETKNGSK